MTEGWDQSWGFADPATAKARGMVVVSGYLSNDSSKNLTVADIKAYHAVGIGVLFNWESDAGRPLLGAAAGKQDATTAVAQARALIAGSGVTPAERVSIYFSCDRDTTPAQYGAIDAYYAATRAVVHAARFGNGAYGEADLVAHLAAAGLTDSEWQTYAWSGGRIDPAADFYQYQNGQKLGGADVDLDRVIHPGQLGALWPAGHVPDNTTTTPLSSEDDMTPEQAQQLNDLHTWFTGGVGPGQRTAGGTIATTLRTVQAIYNRVMAIPTTQPTASGSVDVTALADALAAELGPDLAKQLADDLSKRLAS